MDEYICKLGRSFLKTVLDEVSTNDIEGKVKGDEARRRSNHHDHNHRPSRFRHQQLLEQVHPRQVLMWSSEVWAMVIVDLFLRRNFCQFAIPSLAFTYLFMCTFFLAALSLDQSRIDAGR